MAKFNAGQAVEKLEYDFTDYGGSEGTIVEPSTKQVNHFFKSMKAMLKEVNRLQAATKDIDVENMDDEAMAEHMSKIDEATEGADTYQTIMVENIAVLCGAERVEDEDGSYTIKGGAPSFEELDRLPYRVLQAFSKWLMGEIQPKKTTPGTKR